MNSKLLIKKTCEWCGSTFSAQKSTTRFCSHHCACLAYKHHKRAERIRSLEGEIKEKKIDVMRENLAGREILSVGLAAEFLGVSRASIYRYMEGGILKCLQLPGKTLLRRSDIEILFDEANTYTIRKVPKPENAITELTTIKETAERYKLSLAGVYKIFVENKIPTVKSRGKSYYSLKHVERYFEKRESESFPEIHSWYTVKEIEEKYHMTESEIYNLVSEHVIPKKRVHRTALYSQMHFDQVKNEMEAKRNKELYTVEEAMEKYSFSRDQVYHYLRYNKIGRIKIGRYVKFSREEFDRIFQAPEISP